MSKNNSKTTVMIVIASVMIVAVAGLATYMFVNLNNNSDKKDEIVNKIDIDPGQHEYEVPDEIFDHTKNVILPGWVAFTFPKGVTDISKGIDLYNPEGNFWYMCDECGSQLDENYKCVNENCGKQGDNTYSDCYYMTFKLVLAQNDEVLYESGLVEPGKHIQSITISRTLEEGDYDAYIFIQPYMSDRATALNNGKVNIKLYVR